VPDSRPNKLRQRSAGPDERSDQRTQAAGRSRRIGRESSKTRADLLDAAETLMRTEGYAAVTSRNVAKKAKLTPQLVHYYFETMDELFLALWRRFVGKNLQRQAQAFESLEPLRALWQFSRESADTSLETEFLALAHHRKSIREEIVRDGENFRHIQFDLLSRKLVNHRIGGDGASPEILVVVLSSIARSLIMEKDLGMTAGHRATLKYIERWISSLERDAQGTDRKGG
jgi:AcrR family transcriptional regulator